MATPTLATYGGLTLSPGYPGMIAEDDPDPSIETRINEAAGAVDFGVAVCRGVAVAPGATPNCKAMTTNGQVPIGITVKQASTQIASTDGNNTINYPRYASVPVMKDGVIFATAAETTVEGDAVIAIAADGTLGSATGGAANGTSRMAFDGAVWLTSQAATVLGKIRIKNRV